VSNDNKVTSSPVAELSVERWRDGDIERIVDRLAEEVPVALTYQGVSHVVMLATPTHLEDLAVGFTLSESIVAVTAEIRSVEAIPLADGAFEARVGIDAARFAELLRRPRNLAARSGCGLCGVETIEQAIRQPPVLGSGVRVSIAEVHATLAELRQHQTINQQTGSVHAAAWAVPGQGIRLVREDVGRHNALDKVIGAMVRAGWRFDDGYFVITSRASYEMVQKTATVGASVLVAVSAPTAFAVRLAQQSGLTLIGFAREHQHVVYANSQRLFA
jgi:FdhD protein